MLVEVARIPALLAGHGVRASVGTSVGDAELPAGLRSVTGRKDLVPNAPGACPGVG